jgi:uncharacterized protein YbjT (DUF2867 family)
MKKTAIILGASGLTGGILLQKLIEDDRYEHIKLFSRSKIEGVHNKASQYIGDLLKLEEFEADFTADEVYCCIGTTTKKTPDKDLYRQIDYGIPVSAAKLSKINDIRTFLVMSSMGANLKSNVSYSKMKGEMERDVVQQRIENTFILRPSLIGGERKEHRLLEKIALSVFKIIQPLFRGSFKHYKIIEPEHIAQTMINLANSAHQSEVIITSNDIKEIAKNN